MVDMAKRKRISEADSSPPSRKESKQKCAAVPYLPDEVISNILQWLPAEFLHDNCRYVCKAWCEIISDPGFVKSQQLRSDCGFLIQKSISPFEVVQYVGLKDWRNVKVTKLNRQIPGIISGSSDGLMLITPVASTATLYVANPVTRQVLKLPGPPTSSTQLVSGYSSIASIPQTGEFKVVSLCRRLTSGECDLYVLSVGGNMSWRKICASVPQDYRLQLSIGGVVYWTNTYYHDDGSILAMDLRDESVRYLKVPAECKDGKRSTLLRTEKNVCLMSVETLHQNAAIKVWLLKDLHQSDWVKLEDINISACRGLEDRHIIPLMWLESEQVLVIRAKQCTSTILAYCMKTGECKTIRKYDSVIWHRNTLIDLIEPKL